MKHKENTACDITQIYERHADMLYRISLGILSSSHDAEDAVADVFASFVTKPQSFVDAEHEKAWFIRATVNKCRDLQRRRSLRSHAPLEQAHDIADQSDPLAQLGSVMNELLALPEKYKTVILLHYFEELSIDEIASALSIGRSAVKMRLSRARQQLKELL